ncbi:MAG: DUF4350 domain-containing protein [Flavobacteriaceae bacterium]|nr:DUF4350 domain-containing protein [Flavobacteriaceae bacterium]
MKDFFNFTLLLIFILSFYSFNAQQRAEVIEVPKFKNPKFETNNGPQIYVDHLHNNFHKISGRFKPFADLMKNDGYKVDSLSNYNQLSITDILVISNALNLKNIGNWRRPIYDAFTAEEISMLKKWVESGGSLLLIADHMPMAGAAKTLAKAFGFEFCDGFAFLNKKQQNSPDIFSIENKRLLSNNLINEEFFSLTSFTGSSFSIPKNAQGILKFTKDDYCLAPEVAWQFNKDTPRTSLENKYQGAILEYGKGKIAVFGEAAMFTAQTVTNESGTFKFGFHSKNAPNNINFIRELMYWLSKY